MAEALFDALPYSDGLGPRPGTSATRVGVLSELAVELRLLEAGHAVARPSVDDDGVDLVVDYGVRVQVKGSAAEQYGWGFSRKVLVDGRRLHVRGGLSADVLVLHGQRTDEWWVVPASARELSEGRSTTIKPEVVARWRDRWDVFDSFVVPRPVLVMGDV